MSEGDRTSLATADIMKLLETLPHRFPFLMIDRIIDIDGDRSATGVKNVTINEPHFMGHFPAQPIMPGVLIIEAMAQTAGAISIMERRFEKPAIVYFMTIDKAKFRRPVVPGDRLLIHVKKTRHRANISKFQCVAEVDGAKVAEAEVAAMIGEAEVRATSVNPA